VICENIFNAIIEKARRYKYSSMNYIEFDDCKNAEVLYDHDDLILMQDKNKTPSMLYFATNDFESLIKIVADIPGKLRLHFVPREFADKLCEIGFNEWGEYVDFWNSDLSKTAAQFGNINETEYLNIAGCKKVSEVSRSVRLQSRGFEGETEEWFEEWLNENKVIIQRKDSEIVGFCCISIYDEGTTLWIREVAVDPKYQGMGLGKKLIEQSIKYGVQSGAVKGFLSADVLNKNAIGLYNSYGFYAEGLESELQMIKD